MTFFGLSLVSGVYVTYLMKHGLNLFEINMVNASFFLFLFISEVPTGAFADIFGRKNSFAISCLIFGIGKCVYGLNDTMVGFIIAEIILAIGRTFSTGAFDAWFVDSMKHYGENGSLTKYFAREHMISQICSLVAAILGAYMFAYKIQFPWIFGGVIMMIVGVLAYLLIKEDYWIPKKMSIANGISLMKDTVIKSWKYGRENSAVRTVLVISLIQTLSVQALNMYWQPKFLSLGFHERYLGYIYALIIIFVSIGSMIALRIKTTADEKKMLVISQVVTGFIILCLAMSENLYAILALFLVHEIPRGFMKPVINGFLQSRIPSEERATLSSFAFISSHLGGVIGLVGSGYVAEHMGISYVWFVSGSLFVIGGLIITINGRVDNH